MKTKHSKSSKSSKSIMVLDYLCRMRTQCLSLLLLLFGLLPVATSRALAQSASDYPARYAKAPRFHALFVYDPHAEVAHVQFARQSIEFFHKLSYGEGYTYEVRTSMGGLTVDSLKRYDLVVWLNFQPSAPAERDAFEQYMRQGGGWLGFHASAYNDASTRWPWLNEMLGCGQFLCNSWPPQTVLVDTESATHAITRSLPREWVAPSCEWYQFRPSPRLDKDVEILLSLSPKNYPLGIKDIVDWGDFPIVWTNRRYRMVYLNLGHGDEEYTDATQKLLITNAFRWLVSHKLND